LRRPGGAVDSSLKVPEADAELNACGIKCPEPLMLIRRELRKLPDGAKLKVTGDDPSVTWDVPALCRNMGHQLVYKDTSKAPYTFIIEKHRPDRGPQAGEQPQTH